MSPEPEFWDQVRSDPELMEKAESWKGSQFDESTSFACAFTSPNGKTVTAILRTGYYGSGSLRIPLSFDQTPNTAREVYQKQAVQNNRSVLNITGKLSGSAAFEELGLGFSEKYHTTYADVDTSSSGGHREYDITINAERTTRAKFIHVDGSFITSEHAALATAIDIEAALPGFKLTPIEI